MQENSIRFEMEMHELDFVSVLRAARLTGATRDAVVRQAIVEYLIRLQRQGLDVGIRLPEGEQSGGKQGDSDGQTTPTTQKPGDGPGPTD